MNISIDFVKKVKLVVYLKSIKFLRKIIIQELKMVIKYKKKDLLDMTLLFDKSKLKFGETKVIVV